VPEAAADARAEAGSDHGTMQIKPGLPGNGGAGGKGGVGAARGRLKQVIFPMSRNSRAAARRATESDRAFQIE